MGDAAPYGEIYAALPTPFDDRGAVDRAALDQLLVYFADHALSGLALLTEAGEADFLTDSERRLIVERAEKRLEGRQPYWVSVRDASTRAAAEAARHAQDHGATGVLLSLARLPGVGYADLYRHIDRVARGLELPIVLAVRPGDLAWCLAPEEQAALAKHGKLKGVWLAEAGTQGLAVWAKRFGSEGIVWAGHAFDAVDAAAVGARGAICALSVLAPEPAQAMVQALGRGDLQAIRRIQKRMAPAVERLGPPPATRGGQLERLAERLAKRPIDGARLRAGAPAGLLKAGLALQGHRLQAFVRPPQPQVSDDDRARLRQLMRACGMLGGNG